MVSENSSSGIVDPETTLFWFRRDLRLEDNAGLYHALREQQNVLCLFIFDTEILDALDEKKDRRVEFIYRAVEELNQKLNRLGSSLLVLKGKPQTIFKSLNPGIVFTNRDYEPYAIRRDNDVKNILAARGIELRTFKDQVIFEQNEITKDDGKPYTVYTPYSRKWKLSLTSFYVKSYPVERYLHRLKKINALPVPSMEQIGFEPTDADFPSIAIDEQKIKNYHTLRDFPSVPGTSRLSVHLRFGTVSIRELVKIGLKKNETWLNELIWREFYQMILWHFPRVVTESFKKEYDRIQWRNDEKEFSAWCAGMTGYPIVDAGMRELNATGFMHNRVRMITASFLTKHLLIDWRWGEAYFAKKLLDYDLAANNGGWQWAAGTGCDAAPYFRVFNPQLQTEKFDRDFEYIKKWVPEFGSTEYPKPIVEHAVARDRALKKYRSALEKK